MGPPLYMWSVVDQNVVTQHIPVCASFVYALILQSTVSNMSTVHFPSEMSASKLLYIVKNTFLQM
jgi:hypothetical protein